MKKHFSLTFEKIDIHQGYQQLTDPNSGAICVFIGTVRNMNYRKKVSSLHFEAYENMALVKMEALANTASEKWPLNKVVIIHALGPRKITSPVVFIGTSSAHRAAAFQAAQYLIDQLKGTVPIWKKEIYQDHSTWINAHP